MFSGGLFIIINKILKILYIYIYIYIYIYTAVFNILMTFHFFIDSFIGKFDMKII